MKKEKKGEIERATKMERKTFKGSRNENRRDIGADKRWAPKGNHFT